MIATFESVSKRLGCDHSNESYRADLFSSTVYYAFPRSSYFKSVNEEYNHIKRTTKQAERV